MHASGQPAGQRDRQAFYRVRLSEVEILWLTHSKEPTLDYPTLVCLCLWPASDNQFELLHYCRQPELNYFENSTVQTVQLLVCDAYMTNATKVQFMTTVPVLSCHLPVVSSQVTAVQQHRVLLTSQGLFAGVHNWPAKLIIVQITVVPVGSILKLAHVHKEPPNHIWIRCMGAHVWIT